MLHAFSRTEILLGATGLARLAEAKVAVIGIGGVGSFTVEALARSGVGNLLLVDDDIICLTNVNRQLQATMDVIGQSKVEVMKQRVLSINPQATVTALQRRYTPDNGAELLTPDLDYVVDAVDTVSAKLDIAVRCQNAQLRLISSMGAGNKFDPSRFEVADVYATSICPLARIMRKELRKRGVAALKVVYSREEPVPLQPATAESCSSSGCTFGCKTAASGLSKRRIPGSLAFVPSVAGMIIAAEVVNDLTRTYRPGDA